MPEEKKSQQVGEAVIKPDPNEKEDSVTISAEVIALIAGIVSSDVSGIAGMSGGIVGGIAEKLGRRDLTKGIKVKVEDDKVKIDLNVIAQYGASIVESTNSLKNEIRSHIEKTTGLKVESININVLGLELPNEENEEEAKAKE